MKWKAKIFFVFLKVQKHNRRIVNFKNMYSYIFSFKQNHNYFDQLSTYRKSLPSRSIKYDPSCSSGFNSNLPENIAHSIESGSFRRVSSVVWYILPPTFNFIVLPKWTRFNDLVISSKASFSRLRFSISRFSNSRPSIISSSEPDILAQAESNKFDCLVSFCSFEAICFWKRSPSLKKWKWAYSSFQQRSPLSDSLQLKVI